MKSRNEIIRAILSELDFIVCLVYSIFQEFRTESISDTNEAYAIFVLPHFPNKRWRFMKNAIEFFITTMFLSGSVQSPRPPLRWNFDVTESDYAWSRAYAGDDALIAMTL